MPTSLRSVCLTALVVVAAVGAGCANEKNFVWVNDLPPRALGPSPYRVQIGDTLMVNVWGQASLSQEVVVRPDGNLTLPLIGDVVAAGQTPPSLGQEIGRRLTGLVLDPKVSVSVKTSREPTISVVGEVHAAGAYPLHPGDGVLETLARAGGLSEFANKDRIFIIRRRGEPMRVRFKYDALAAGDGAGLAFSLQDGDILVVE